MDQLLKRIEHQSFKPVNSPADMTQLSLIFENSLIVHAKQATQPHFWS
jgi:hypothetical protein